MLRPMLLKKAPPLSKRDWLRIQSEFATYPFLQLKNIEPYPETRYLILTADDFCCARCIDAGSMLGFSKGIVNTFTAMTTFSGAAETIRQATITHPKLNIGVHLNITSGYPLSPKESIPTLLDKDAQFYKIQHIMARLKRMSLTELEIELRAQIEEFLKSGARLDHLSYQYNILALYAPFFEVVMQLAKDYGVPVRNPIAHSMLDKTTFKKPGTQVVGRKLARNFILRHPVKAVRIARHFKSEWMLERLQQLKEREIKHPDHLIDYFYGNPTSQNMLDILNHLPPGTSELMLHLGQNCHPKELGKGIDKYYLPYREQETAIVTREFLRPFLEKKNIQVISFSDL